MHSGFQHLGGMPCRSYLTVPKLTNTDRSTKPGVLLEVLQVLCTVKPCMHLRSHSGTEGLNLREKGMPQGGCMGGGLCLKATDAEQPVDSVD